MCISPKLVRYTFFPNNVLTNIFKNGIIHSERRINYRPPGIANPIHGYGKCGLANPTFKNNRLYSIFITKEVTVMKKITKITSALVSVAMCAGIIGVLSANASEVASEPAQNAGAAVYNTSNPSKMSIEEFDKMVEEMGIVDVSVPKSPSQKLVEDAYSVNGCKCSEYVDKVLENLEAALGFPAYPTSAPIPIEDLESPERAYGFFPTSSTTLPYPIYLGETSKGDAVASKYYFYVTDKPIELEYALQVRGNNDKEAVLKTTLYREQKKWAGLDSWQTVKSWNQKFNGIFGTEYEISDVDSDYVYCLVFENISDINCTISGVITVCE